jgi:hypothetical protein
VTPTAANPTGVQNGIEHRFERSKKRARFKNEYKRRQDGREDGREDKKTEKTKVADERKIRHDFSDTTFQTQLLDTAFRNEE